MTRIFLSIIFFVLYVGCTEKWESALKHKEQIKNSITISMSYNITNCGLGYPLLVNVVNNSKDTIKEISWELGAFNPGFSTNISRYMARYSCDKILFPGQQWNFCKELPLVVEKSGYNLSKLDYEVVPGSIDVGITSYYY